MALLKTTIRTDAQCSLSGKLDTTCDDVHQYDTRADGEDNLPYDSEEEAECRVASKQEYENKRNERQSSKQRDESGKRECF